MNVYCGWAARTLAASHAACGAQRGSATPALRSPLDPCQRGRILRLDNDAIQEPPPGTYLTVGVAAARSECPPRGQTPGRASVFGQLTVTRMICDQSLEWPFRFSLAWNLYTPGPAAGV